MVLGHQVDTLRVFGIDPIKSLLPPHAECHCDAACPHYYRRCRLALRRYYIAVFMSHQSAMYTELCPDVLTLKMSLQVSEALHLRFHCIHK